MMTSEVEVHNFLDFTILYLSDIEMIRFLFFVHNNRIRVLPCLYSLSDKKNDCDDS